MSAIAAGTWTADELMNGKVASETTSATISSSVGSNGGGGTSTTSPTKAAPTKQFSMMKLAKTKKGGPMDPMDWGMPGHLTEEEVVIFVS
jgi:hypothetical protein